MSEKVQFYVLPFGTAISCHVKFTRLFFTNIIGNMKNDINDIDTHNKRSYSQYTTKKMPMFITKHLHET